MPKVNLTTVQLQAMLNAKIRERARWRIRDAVEEGGPGGLTGGSGELQVNDRKLRVVASSIYDDMMGDLSFASEDNRLLQAMNSLGDDKFTVAYVVGVIRKAIKDEALSLEAAALDGMVAEKCGSALKGKKVKRRK